MEKTGFIYIWYDRKRKMYYIGSHWGRIDDGYICSSNRMRDAYRRRPQDFKRRIIKIGIERTKLLDEEHEWLQKIKESELGKKYYNLRQHKWGHWSTDVNMRDKIVSKLYGNTNRLGKSKTQEEIEKIRKAHMGKPKSEETKRKMSAYWTGRKRDSLHVAAIVKSNTGKKRSEETKRKMSESQKRRQMKKLKR